MLKKHVRKKPQTYTKDLARAVCRVKGALLPDLNLFKYLDCLPKVSRK